MYDLLSKGVLFDSAILLVVYNRMCDFSSGIDIFSYKKLNIAV